MILGIDIGGANTKIASSDGKLVELHYLPLWKNSRLPEALLEISARLKPEKVGVVITGELAANQVNHPEGKVAIGLDAEVNPEKESNSTY